MNDMVKIKIFFKHLNSMMLQESKVPITELMMAILLVPHSNSPVRRVQFDEEE